MISFIKRCLLLTVWMIVSLYLAGCGSSSNLNSNPQENLESTPTPTEIPGSLPMTATPPQNPCQGLSGNLKLEILVGPSEAVGLVPVTLGEIPFNILSTGDSYIVEGGGPLEYYSDVLSAAWGTYSVTFEGDTNVSGECVATGEDALEHETRRMIYNHIISHPGVSYKILKNVFSLTDGTLRYHLDYLERAEKISFGLAAGKRLYYPFHNEIAAARQPSGTSKTYDLTPLQERILNTIKRYPGITQKELDKAKKQARAAFAYGTESVTNQAYWLAQSAVLKDYEWNDSYVSRLEAVTLDDIQEATQRYFVPQKRVTGWLVPTGMEGE